MALSARPDIAEGFRRWFWKRKEKDKSGFVLTLGRSVQALVNCSFVIARGVTRGSRDVQEGTQPGAAVIGFSSLCKKEFQGETDAGKHREFIGTKVRI